MLLATGMLVSLIAGAQDSEYRQLFDYPVRDTCICLVDDTYYLTGTTGFPTWWDTNEGIRIWKSQDLKDWTPLGLVWTFEKDATWQRQVKEGKRAIWAPELHYLKNTLWITYCVNWPGGGTGILKSTSGKPEGPYKDVCEDAPLTQEIDASLFQDDNGKVYFVFQNGRIARMKDDMSGLAETPRLIKPEKADQVGFEGAFMFKANGRYYLSCADFVGPQNDQQYHCFIAQAERLDGPWSERYLAVPGGGHNMFFKTTDGSWYSTVFGNDSHAPFKERPGIVPVIFDPSGKVILSKSEHVTTDAAVRPTEGAGVFGAYAASKDYTPPQDPAVLKKLSEWQDQKLGLLITWGTYSQWGIVESWTLCPERYEWNRRTGPFANDDRAYKASYEELINTFNPTKFDSGKWAAAVKDGGVKYVLVMAKHHDGFCMFDTAMTDYRITSPRCPFHTDPRANVLKEMSAAFRKEGLSTGIYFSKADWNSPFYWSPDFPLCDRNVNYDTTKRPDLWGEFKDFTWRQIEELMTGYGPQDILWLDGGQVRPPDQDIDITGMAAMAREHQPGLIVVDRTVRGENENYVTPEQKVPDHYLPYPWETCMTMGTAWPWKPNDQFKSTGTLIRTLCTIVARGGNLLLGIGPDANGEFDRAVYGRLDEMGKWLKLNGEAVYETRPKAPYEQDGCVFTQKRDGTVYAIILPKDDNGGLPESFFIPAELNARAGSISLLGFGEIEHGAATPGDKAVITIPPLARANPPCAHAWAIKIEPK